MSAGNNRSLKAATISPPENETIKREVHAALAEDIGSGDVTSRLIAESSDASARVICRETAVLCGRPWFDQVFAQLDTRIRVTWNQQDGDALVADDEICRLEGPARALLTGERTALNFLQLLSGVATFTRECVGAVEGTQTKILDTRKTLPGLRLAQKYAVRCGGGTNHRIGLFDAYLIKENHIASAGSIADAVKTAREHHFELTLEVEVETLEQLDEALGAGADVVMLDNFDLAGIQTAVARTAGRAKLEVSGNVTLAGLRELANTGVDYISLGAITKNVRAIDFSMRFDPAR